MSCWEESATSSKKVGIIDKDPAGRLQEELTNIVFELTVLDGFETATFTESEFSCMISIYSWDPIKDKNVWDGEIGKRVAESSIW